MVTVSLVFAYFSSANANSVPGNGHILFRLVVALNLLRTVDKDTIPRTQYTGKLNCLKSRETRAPAFFSKINFQTDS